MAINITDVSVASNGDIRWTGGATTNYSVLELHRFLGDLADDASAINDDFVDITSDTPSDRSTDNIITLLGTYNINDAMAQHLYDGSISQAGGNTLYSGLRVLGAVNNINTQLTIVQNNALIAPTFWGTQATGGFNGNATSGILFRCLIKSREAGADIDGKRIRVQSRHWGDTYDFFNVTLGQGESVAAIGTTPDAQNNTTQGIVTVYTGITNTQGYQLIDLNNGNGGRPYYSQWTYGIQPLKLKALWEYIKDLTGTGTVKSLYGLNGALFLGVTHEVTVTAISGAFTSTGEIVSWGTGITSGTGRLLAIDNTTGAGSIWFQLLTGIIPSGTITGATSTRTAVTNVVSAKTIPKTFLGSYTGSLIGAYGVGVLPANVVATDTIQDLLGSIQTPPNNVTFTVSGLVSGEDRVLVGPRLAGALWTGQMSANTTSSGVTTITMTAPIPTDTPSSGTIRVLGNGGVYNRIPYVSYVGSTFTLSGTTPVAITQNANAYVSYIDKLATATSESFTTVFSTTRDLFIRVRDGAATPIKTFESAGTLGAAGGSTVASRITDL
jgi:hypothetical protein